MRTLAMLLALFLAAGCAAKKKPRQQEEVIQMAVPDCTRLKEECEIKNNKLSKECVFLLSCTKVKVVKK